MESILCETGTNASEEPAVWIYLNVSDEATAKKWIAKESRVIHEEVEAAFERIGVKRWPYKWFQSLSELAEFEKGAR